MFQDPPETSELQAFVAVVDAHSISGAARELGLPRSTVSRRLARLEERLNRRLLRASTRRLHVTEAGGGLSSGYLDGTLEMPVSGAFSGSPAIVRVESFAFRGVSTFATVP